MSKRPDMKKVSAASLEQWCREFGLPTDGGVADMVDALVEYQSTPEVEPHLLVCDCGAECDGRLPVCPFCGHGDDDDEPAAASSGAKTEESTVKKRSQAKSAKAAPAKEKAKGKGKAPAKSPEVQEAATAMVVAGSTELATTATEADLDEQIRTVQSLHNQAVVCYWDIGNALYRIFKERLYVLRRGEDGTPRYKSWSQFVAAEIGISSSHSYRMFEVALMYTREQATQLGITKLSVLAKLDDGERSRMMETAAGKSVAALTKEVDAITGGKRATPTAAEKAGHTFRGGKAAASKGTATRVTRTAAKRLERATAAATAAKVDTKQVTVAQLLGRVTIPLFKKGSETRARKLADMPSGTEALVNGVTVTYKLVEQPKGLALVIDRKRGE